MSASQKPQKSESLNSILANKQLELKVLYETIKAKESYLKKIKTSIERSSSSLQDLQDRLRELGTNRNSLLADIKLVRKNLEQEIKESQKRIDALLFEEKAVQQAIKERNDYLKEQEGQISKALEEGNQKLLSAKYEVEEFERIKQTLNNEIYENKQELELIRINRIKELNVVSDIQTSSEVLMAKAENDLKKIQDQIGSARLELQAITDETDHKLGILRGKEESIVARENAIKVRKEELDRRERRLNSFEQLYS